MSYGIFKQRIGMVAVDVMATCGVLTPEQWVALGEVALRNQVFRFKFTTRQTVVVVLPEENVPSFAKNLEAAGLKIAPYKMAVRAVKACAGHPALCPRSLADALGLGISLQERYTGQKTPKDFKIAVAGCARGCTDPQCADFGARASGEERYDIFIGGRGGTVRPVHGRLMARSVSAEQVQALLGWVLERYKAVAQPFERLGQTIDRVGLDYFLPPEELTAQSGTDEASEFATFLQS